MINTDMKVDFSIVLLYQYLRYKRLIEKPRPSNHFWPSEMTADISDGKIIRTIGKCARAIYYSIIGIPGVPPSAMSIRKMRIGKLIEQEYISDLKNAGITVMPDVPILFNTITPASGTQISIGGRIDTIIYDIDSKQYDIYELKSAYGYKFENDVMKKGLFNEGYAMQLGLYMYGIRVFNSLNGSNIDSSAVRTGILKYISRGNCEVADNIYIDIDNLSNIVVKTKTKEVKLVNMSNILNKLSNITNCVDNNILPNRDFIPVMAKDYIDDAISRHRYNGNMTAPDWQCSYCPYRNECIQNYNPDRESSIKNIEENINKIKVQYKDAFSSDIDEVLKSELIVEEAEDI